MSPRARKEEAAARPRSAQLSAPPSSSPDPSMPRQWLPLDSQSIDEPPADPSSDEITSIVKQGRGGAKDYRTGQASPPVPRPASNAGASTSGDPPRQRKASPAADPSRPRLRPSRPRPSEGEEADFASGDAKGKWWKNILEKYGSVELDNKGSVARDHLALERTFLSWLRTSLAFASIGIAVTQLFRLNVSVNESPAHRLAALGKPLGATFLGISILVLVVGGRRYFESQVRLRSGAEAPARQMEKETPRPWLSATEKSPLTRDAPPQYWIIRGKFPASRGSVALITAVAAALIVSSLVVVCIIDPSTIT
ncbi:hypothetical protein MMC08_004417 [Hypocenomyce scalaris]|nr:hypothetical protein [Hypocenomyce scalaris]